MSDTIDISALDEARERRLLPKLVVGDFRLQIETLRMKRPNPLTLFAVVVDYLQEYVIPQPDVQANRYVYTFNHVLRLVDPRMQAVAIGRSTARDYTAKRRAEGMASGTIRRELTLLLAAVNHAFKEERVPKVLSFKGVMPPQGAPRERYLERAEFDRLMLTPMPPRIYRFFILDFMCGVRSRAIEELTWDRVNFRDRTIDFRVPGMRRTNKRRAVLPMSDELRRVLEAAFIRPTRKPDDPYVIGLGERGKLACTWKECKAVMVAAGINERGVARHVARKTWASHALQNDVPMAKVAAFLADNPTTVEKAYAFILPEHLRDAANFRDRKAA